MVGTYHLPDLGTLGAEVGWVQGSHCALEAVAIQRPQGSHCQSLHLFPAGRRASLGSCCCSSSSVSSLGTSFSSSYQDLAKHIVDISMADVRNCSA